ncbi:MAG: DUF882 domain-containing protein [Amphritea sp.]|nr:DUF882 domain-containing protein [Amphritea sp.]
MRNTLHSRRTFLRRMGLLTAGSALSSQTLNQQLYAQTAPKLPKQDLSLSFSNLHTGESLKTTFFAEGQFIPESMQEISRLLRDHRNNQVGEMNPQLMMYLHDLQQNLGVNKEFQVISGYRSPETNAMLSQRSNKVAKKSLHMQGKAIDVRLPGTDLKQLHKAAMSMKRGGVGLYTRSQFVHLDVGRYRYWGS